MAERNKGIEDLSDEQLRDEYTKLESEYSRIDDDFQDEDMPEIIKVKYDRIIDRVHAIEREQDLRQEVEYETSFIDDDDGKTVTVRGPGGSRVTAPSAEFVHDDDIPPPPKNQRGPSPTLRSTFS